MNDTEQMKDGFLYLMIFLVLIVASAFIPLVLLPAVFLFPLPFLLFTYKYDWKKALVFTIISALLSFILFGDLGLLISVLAGATGVLIGSALHHRMKPYDVWSRGALGGIIGLLFIFVYIQIIFQVNWQHEIIEFTKDSIALSEQMFESIGIGTVSSEQLQIIEDQMLSFTKLIPAFILLSGSIYGCIVQWIGHKAINRIHQENFRFPPFRTLRFPAVVIWIYLIVLIITLFQSGEPGTLMAATENIVVVLGALLLIQGFSFLFYLSYEKKIPRPMPVLAIVLTVMFPFLFLFIIRLLGIADIGFDMRKFISDRDE